MTINNLSPYLFFNGAAEAALGLYERALGAKREAVMRYADAPCPNKTPGGENLIMHAALRVGEQTLMLSDSPQPVKPEGNVQVALDFKEPADMARAFEGLAEGGTVTTPIQDMFFGAKFGSLQDAYGVRWLFH